MGYSSDFMVQDVSLDGFDIISSQYFTRKLSPTMTIWKTAISFNSVAFKSLSNCDYIQIMINNAERQILIRPATSRDTDIINWSKRPSEKNYCRLECALFAKRVYETWKLDEKLRYRFEGRLVQYNEKLMILFSIKSSQAWDGRKLIK